MGVLPRDLLSLGRLREAAEPSSEAGIRRGQLVRLHGLGPRITRMTNGAHDVGALAIKIFIEAH